MPPPFILGQSYEFIHFEKQLSILEKNIKVDVELEAMLKSFSALDLAEILVSENVKADQLVNLNLEELETIGIPLERAERFLSEVKKDQERKESLLERLKEIHCEEIFSDLAEGGCTSEEVISLDDDALRKLGIDFKKRKNVLPIFENVRRNERRPSLRQKLKEIHCEEIFHNLADAGSTLEELFSLDNDALEKFGIDLKQRKKILTKIQNARDADICKYQI